jgi:DNA-binding protein
MPKNKNPIASAPLKRILKENGANRVSADALTVLAEYLEEQAKGIARESIKLAKHAQRRTVLKEDVMLAAKGKSDI